MTDSKPLLSIVMPAYNAQNYISKSINSVKYQTFKDWELIIIDDSSNDNTWEVMKTFADDKRIKLFQNEKNYGHAYTSNKGIHLSIGKYIAKMDADDIIFQNRFEKQIQFLNNNPNIDVVGCGTIKTTHDLSILDVRSAPSDHDTITKYIRLNKNFIFGPNFIITDGTIVAKADWFKKWLYDPKIKVAQDFDLMLRACSTSKYANISDPLYIYRRVGETSSFSKQTLGALTKLLSVLKYEKNIIVKFMASASCLLRPIFVILTEFHHQIFSNYKFGSKKFIEFQNFIRELDENI